MSYQGVDQGRAMSASEQEEWVSEPGEIQMRDLPASTNVDNPINDDDNDDDDDDDVVIRLDVSGDTQVPVMPPKAALAAHAAGLARGKKHKFKLMRDGHGHQSLGLKLRGGISPVTDLYEIIVDELPDSSGGFSLAATAGLRVGDEILEVQGRKVGQRGGLAVLDTLVFLRRQHNPALVVLRPSVAEQVRTANRNRAPGCKEKCCIQ